MNDLTGTNEERNKLRDKEYGNSTIWFLVDRIKNLFCGSGGSDEFMFDTQNNANNSNANNDNNNLNNNNNNNDGNNNDGNSQYYLKKEWFKLRRDVLKEAFQTFLIKNAISFVSKKMLKHSQQSVLAEITKEFRYMCMSGGFKTKKR